MDALALLANTKLLPLVNAAIAANYAGSASPWGDSVWTYHDATGTTYNGSIKTFSGVNIYDKSDMTVLDSSPHRILNPQPTYVFDITKPNWRDELNRMRGDYYALIYNNVAGASGIFESLSNIVSGPWIVDVNDPVTFPRVTNPTPTQANLDYPLDGIFSGSISGSPCWFSNLEFYYAHDDAPSGITIDTVRHADLFMPPDGTNPGGGIIYNGLINNSLTITYAAASAGQFKAVIKFPFDGSSLPAASVFSPTATPSAGITFSTEINTLSAQYQGAYNLVVTIDVALSGSGIIVLTAGAAAGYTVGTSGRYYSRGNLIFSTSSSVATAQGIHPTSSLKVMTTNDQPAGDFVLNGSGTIAAWILSNVELMGCWSAKTLPVPGINFFLDQDMPPFVSKIGYSPSIAHYDIAVGTGNNVNDIASSSMRAPTIGSEDATKFSALKSSLSARPTPYQVFRDTDFVPWNYGYPTGTSIDIFSNQTATADATLNQYSISVPSDITNIKIRCVASGTAKPGWKFYGGVGMFQYGEPLPTMPTFTIYVRQADRPTALIYDFKVDANGITINPNGGGSYLAGVLNDYFYYAIQNNSGADISYDLITELDTAASFSLTIPPPKQYFPVARECFSYCISDEPIVLLDFFRGLPQENLFQSKPIAQNGYCIFKLRATRLPVQNSHGFSVTPSSGPSDIVVKVGQNILQPDNTLVFTPLKTSGGADYTITIPMASRDSGDVEVYWPVLGGNELVYQCDEGVILEAWANWQPIFFNHGLGLYFDLYGSLTQGLANPIPTQFTYALGFVNRYFPYWSGYPIRDSSLSTDFNLNVAAVQYPISVEIYNDLEAVLNLI